jgi:hypothetical protein
LRATGRGVRRENASLNECSRILSARLSHLTWRASQEIFPLPPADISHVSPSRSQNKG